MPVQNGWDYLNARTIKRFGPGRSWTEDTIRQEQPYEFYGERLQKLSRYRYTKTDSFHLIRLDAINQKYLSTQHGPV